MNLCTKNSWKKAMLVITMLLGFFFIDCKKEEEKKAEVSPSQGKSSLTGVILFAVGDVKSGGKKLKSGDVVSENDVILTGKKSTCDLQLKESEAGIVVRMKSESVFELKTRVVKDQATASPVIKAGNVLVNVSGKLKTNENFQIVTPTTVAGVRGTKFEVNVLEDGSTTVTVSEGSVATKMRLSEIDDLPTDVQQKSKLVISVNELLDSKEEILEAGQKVQIKKKDTELVGKETGLTEGIKQINLETKNNQEMVAILDKSLQGKEGNGALPNVNPELKVEKISNNDLQTKLKEFNELIAIEKQKLASEESTTLALKEREEKNQEILSKRIEEITGKKFETLILKSGKKVRGSVFQEGDTYYVITTSGQETYKEDEVEGMEL